MAAYLPAMFHMANTEIVSQARKFLHVNIPRFLAVNDYDGDEFRASRRLSAGGMHNDDLLGDYMCTICTVCHTITARVRRPHGIRSARSPLPPRDEHGESIVDPWDGAVWERTKAMALGFVAKRSDEKAARLQSSFAVLVTWALSAKSTLWNCSKPRLMRTFRLFRRVLQF
jgi:hypothetical protein